MGRKLLQSVATYSGYELDQLQKDFIVERNELEDGSLEIISPLETIYRTPSVDDSGKIVYEIDRELVSIGRRVKTRTSTKYHILSASEILDRMFTTDIYEAIRRDINSVGIDSKGGVIVRFKQESSDLKVLDANHYNIGIKITTTPPEFVRKDFSSYHPVMMITNSTDRSIAVGAIAGLYRLICSNGLYDLTNLFGRDVINTGRRRHFKTQADQINDVVDSAIQALPEFADTSDKINRFRDAPIKTPVSELQSILDSWIEEKRKVSTIQNSTNFAAYAEELYKVWRNNIHKVENLLDFENLMGYFKNPERFGVQVSILAKEIENRLIPAF
jgi:hypothetical protein